MRKKPKNAATAGITGGSNIPVTKSGAVLHTTSSKERREIKRIPSKTKVNHEGGKSKKRKLGGKNSANGNGLSNAMNNANVMHHGADLASA